MGTTSAWSQIESTLEIIQNRDTAYGELTDRFGSLFEKKEQVRTNLIAVNLQSLKIDADRIAAGTPILADVDITPWADAFKESSDALLPVLTEVLQLGQETYQKIQTHLADTKTLLGLIKARIDGNTKHLADTSDQLGLTPPTLLSYILEAVSAPVFSAIVYTLGDSLSSLSWEHGQCPVCGSAPSISQLCPKDTNANEYLVGGGGKKYLHCALCGHDWHYKRNACAACGNDDSETREILFVDGVQHERIEVCHSCGKYMINVDMREYAFPPHLDTIQMGLIHLDILAHERQLSPVSPTLWNTIK